MNQYPHFSRKWHSHSTRNGMPFDKRDFRWNDRNKAVDRLNPSGTFALGDIAS